MERQHLSSHACRVSYHRSNFTEDESTAAVFIPYIYLAYIYFVLSLIVPLPYRRSIRIAVALATFLVCQHHLIQKWVFGTMFSPEIARVFVILLGWLYCTFFLLLIITLLVDICRLLAWLIRRRRAIDKTLMTRARHVMIVFSALLAGIGVSQAIAVPEVRRVALAVDDLPRDLEGFKLVQLTDLHTSRLMNAAWISQVVARTNALQADAIVITGDLIDGTPQARHDDIAPLGTLQARHGVIASLGNHEYYFGAERWTKEFERLGMRVLANRHTVIQHGAGRLTIAAVTDPVAPRFGMQGPDTARALQGATAGAPVVLLSHQPVRVADNAQLGIDLQLSGHTHGGMIRGIDKVVEIANGGFVSGLYRVGGMQLYVSNGTGLWNGFPIRLGVPAEITEFTLTKASTPTSN